MITLLGIVMPVNLSQYSNAKSEMLVTPFGMITLPVFPQGQQYNMFPVFEYKMPSTLL
jgi:hypothetical protein